jgi:hypothetical protein
MTDEHTSREIAALAAKGLRDPESLTGDEVRRLAASALTQAENRPHDEGPPRSPS